MNAHCGCRSGDACGCGGSARGDPCRDDCCAPDPGTNPPGLDQLAYRATGYDATLDRMRGRLSEADLPALRDLTARRLDEAVDPAMALLDGWACLGHILGFYNERFVNEHYLRTCTERRSALELARLVGYAPRPGVAADVYLAFTLDDTNKEAELEVPKGTRAYSQPGPGETMEPFETSERLWGRPRWSEMRPRLTEPQQITEDTLTLSLKGTATNLRKGDTLLLKTGDSRVRKTVATVEPIAKTQFVEAHTVVVLEREPPPNLGSAEVSIDLGELIRDPAVFAASRDRLELNPASIFTDGSYAVYGILGAAYPALRERLGAALGGTTPGGESGAATVFAMRVKAALHGHNAPLIPDINSRTKLVTGYKEWNIEGTGRAGMPAANGTSDAVDGKGDHPPLISDDVATALSASEIALDAVYDQILPGSLVVITRPRASSHKDEVIEHEDVITSTVVGVRTMSRVEFNLPARVTVLTLEDKLEELIGGTVEDFGDLRNIVVYAQAERLELVEMAIESDLAAGVLELDGYYDGLRPGRRVIVTGERADLGGVTGVKAAELLLIASVWHVTRLQAQALSRIGANVPTGGATYDTIHTWIAVADPQLKYRYRRDTVKILGNVAHATHGESRAEVLGSGDAARPLQTFALKQNPLTYVSAPTVAGTANTLEVRVNELRWHEVANPAAVAKDERRYLLRTDDESATSVIFGMGARLPTGRDNVRATYRSGIGAAGNVKAGQVSVLASRPNGVMGVTNPLAATGGADRDGIEGIRRRTPIGLSALDRLVSAADMADFARAFGGIGKAGISCQAAAGATVACSQSTVEHVILTIAGENDAPIALDSALVTNLVTALMRFGDLEWDAAVPGQLKTRGAPSVTVKIAVRNALLLGICARIRLEPEYEWEEVLPRVQAALYRVFGFDARELGQAAYPGVAIATMQEMRGVAWVDPQAFGPIDTIDTGTPGQPATPEQIVQQAHDLFVNGTQNTVRPDADTIAYLSPDAPGTLLLSPIEEEPSP